MDLGLRGIISAHQKLVTKNAFAETKLERGKHSIIRIEHPQAVQLKASAMGRNQGDDVGVLTHPSENGDKPSDLSNSTKLKIRIRVTHFKAQARRKE